MAVIPVARSLVAAAAVAIGAGCGGGTGDTVGTAAASLPRWSFDSTMVFPANRSLARPEDGLALPDGRLFVADQPNGLRLVETDGTSIPFGELAAAGYRHRPPDHPGGANGVSLEPGGDYLLVADIFGGAIYRVDITSGETEKVYQHRYGINTAVRDSEGSIWFTQSARNTPEAGEARMWATVDRPVAEGALLRLPSRGGKLATEAVVVVDSLLFANGLAIDEKNGHLYVAETMGGRVLRFRVDVTAGTVSDRSVFVDGVGADNIELDGEGYLWVAAPMTNELLMVNTSTGARHTAFSARTAVHEEFVAEFTRRGQAGASRMELLTPALWAPLPGLVTGVILRSGGGPGYLTGLGNALVRLPR
ncbi:MAG: SMP-30/gluconolactonase/LRE family protein [Gemmatimonadales bacterium]